MMGEYLRQVLKSNETITTEMNQVKPNVLAVYESTPQDIIS